MDMIRSEAQWRARQRPRILMFSAVPSISMSVVVVFVVFATLVVVVMMMIGPIITTSVPSLQTMCYSKPVSYTHLRAHETEADL
eukprot:2744424-Amphidinium_carterae.1